MSGNVVFDTNAILDLFNGTADLSVLRRETHGKEQWVSVITRIELLALPAITSDEEMKLTAFLAKRRVIPITEAVEQRAIEFRRKTKRKLPDAIIAAAAIVLEAKLLTRDTHLLNVDFPNLRTVHSKEIALKIEK